MMLNAPGTAPAYEYLILEPPLSAPHPSSSCATVVLEASMRYTIVSWLEKKHESTDSV